MQTIPLGILLGLGASVPIGPVNVEMAKRNLAFGTKVGLALGLGACSIDVLYLILLSQGLLYFFNQKEMLATLGIISAFVLFFFSYKAFTAPNRLDSGQTSNTTKIIRHYLDGVLITATNPYTIMFWGSVGSQINLMKTHKLVPMGFGLILGILLWVVFLNGCLHITRKRISSNFQHYLNLAGGIILAIIASLGLYKSYLLML